MSIRLLVLALLATVLFGQSAPVVEPDFPDVIFGLDTGKLVKLERQEARTEARVSITLSAKGKMAIPGATSPVRFPSGHPLEFVVKSPGSLNADPDSLYHLRKMESTKKGREILLARASVLGAKGVTDNLLSLEFAKYGESSLKITTTSLEQGEYAIGKTRGQVLFCFGVD